MQSFNRIKQNAYFKDALDGFIDTLLAMGIGKKHRRKLEKTIWSFLLRVKEQIYRQVDYEYHREDVTNKIKEYYGCKGLTLVSAMPEYIIAGIIDTWQDDLGDADTFTDINWSILEDVLYGEQWLSGLKKFKLHEIKLYKCYLKDWYATHKEGDPVCISEFFDCEMKDEDTRNYYLALAGKRRAKKGV